MAPPERTVTATRIVTGFDDVMASDVPGAYYIDAVPSLIYVCPCGCGELNSIPLKPAGAIEPKRGWIFDGNYDTPTVTPSIKRLNGCRYHGFLTNGVWTFCGDSGVGRQK